MLVSIVCVKSILNSIHALNELIESPENIILHIQQNKTALMS